MLNHPIYTHYYRGVSGRKIVKLSNSKIINTVNVNDLIFEVGGRRQAAKIIDEWQAIKYTF